MLMHMLPQMTLLIAACACIHSSVALRAPIASVASSRRSSRLHSIKVSVLDPDDAAAQGVREWPFNSRPKGVSEETVAAGTVRYVLEGTGDVECSDFAGGVAVEDPVEIGPGSLIEATEQCNIRWRSDDGFTILTPGFEDYSTYFAVVAVLVAGFGYALGPPSGRRGRGESDPENS